MLGYQLRYRKGSFEFIERFLSKSGASLRGAALMADAHVYDLAIFGGDGRLVASETEIALISGRDPQSLRPART
jgi:hypothetical protein